MYLDNNGVLSPSLILAQTLAYSTVELAEMRVFWSEMLFVTSFKNRNNKVRKSFVSLLFFTL